jgi:hypothetical protein
VLTPSATQELLRARAVLEGSERGLSSQLQAQVLHCCHIDVTLLKTTVTTLGTSLTLL